MNEALDVEHFRQQIPIPLDLTEWFDDRSYTISDGMKPMGSQGTMEKDPPDSRLPRYKVGDEVALVSEGRTLTGVVEIIEGSLDRVHHY